MEANSVTYSLLKQGVMHSPLNTRVRRALDQNESMVSKYGGSGVGASLSRSQLGATSANLSASRMTEARTVNPQAVDLDHMEMREELINKESMLASQQHVEHLRGLESEIYGKDREIDGLRGEVQDLKSVREEVVQRRSELIRAKQGLEQLSMDVRVRDGEINELRHSKAQQETDLRRVIAEQNGAMDALRERIGQANARADAAQREVDSSRVAVSQLSSEGRASQQKEKDLRARLSESYDDVARERRLRQEAIAEARAVEASVRKDLQEAKLDYQAAVARAQEANSRTAATEHIVSEKEEEIAVLERQLSHSQTELTETAQVAARVPELVKKSDYLEVVSRELDSVREDLAQTRVQLGDTEADLERSRRERVTAEQTNEAMEATMRSLRERIDELCTVESQLASEKADSKALENRLGDTQWQLERTSKSLAETETTLATASREATDASSGLLAEITSVRALLSAVCVNDDSVGIRTNALSNAWLETSGAVRTPASLAVAKDSTTFGSLPPALGELVLEAMNTVRVLQETRAQLAARDAHISDVESTLRRTEDTLEDTKLNLSMAETRITTLADLLTKTKHTLTDSQDDVDAKEARIAVLEEDLAQRDNKLMSLTESLQSITAEETAPADSWEELMAQSSAAVTSSLAKVSSLTSRLDQATIDNQHAQAEIGSLKRTLADTYESNAEQRRSTAAAHDATVTENARQAAADTAALRERYEGEKDSLRRGHDAVVSQLRGEIDNLNGSVGELNEALARTESDRRALQLQVEETTRDKRVLQDSLTNTQHDKQLMRERATSLQGELDEVLSKASKLQNQEMARRRREESESEYESAEGESESFQPPSPPRRAPKKPRARPAPKPQPAPEAPAEEEGAEALPHVETEAERREREAREAREEKQENRDNRRALKLMRYLIVNGSRPVGVSAEFLSKYCLGLDRNDGKLVKRLISHLHRTKSLENLHLDVGSTQTSAGLSYYLTHKRVGADGVGHTSVDKRYSQAQEYMREQVARSRFSGSVQHFGLTDQYGMNISDLSPCQLDIPSLSPFANSAEADGTYYFIRSFLAKHGHTMPEAMLATQLGKLVVPPGMVEDRSAAYILEEARRVDGWAKAVTELVRLRLLRRVKQALGDGVESHAIFCDPSSRGQVHLPEATLIGSLAECPCKGSAEATPECNAQCRAMRDSYTDVTKLHTTHESAKAREDKKAKQAKSQPTPHTVTKTARPGPTATQVGDASPDPFEELARPTQAAKRLRERERDRERGSPSVKRSQGRR
ncbi:hypothetical protein KIPB_000503 [Kipferlia bialata]|uniref:Uncharacterized protein n=1 Tax=Kipferlia bialata TaxID=797122 RepID=A0A9K3CQL6_9EUKA|nr:hypothetical protein KIPB_000503 [Kipferlia bialata]|eukprot:g503.t1